MVDIIQIVVDNKDIILIMITFILAFVAKYFKGQADAFSEAAQAITDLTQEVLTDVKDGVVSKEELDSILAKIAAAKKEIQDVIDIFTTPVPVTEKLASIFTGYKAERIAELHFQVQQLKTK